MASLSAMASRTGIAINYNKKNQTSQTTVERSAFCLPLDVYFNEESSTIEVECSDEYISGEIYICDKNGSIIAYSSSINAIIQLPNNNHSIYYILIDSSDWYATASIAF
jgi:hypothetical protein